MATSIKTPFGTILLNKEDSNWFYFSNSIEEKYLTYYGYKFNFTYSANPSTYFKTIEQMWNHIAENKSDETIHLLIHLLENNTEDTKCFYSIFSSKAIDNLYQYIQEVCEIKDGIPVSTKEQQVELEHIGKNCIIVSETFQRLLLKQLGSLEDVKKKAAKPTFEVIDVPETDKRILYEIIDDIHESYSFATIDRIKICTFENDKYCGLHGNKDGMLYINKNILNDYKEVLITLVHEFAHDFGVDGTKSHLDAVQIIFSEIIERQRNQL